MAATQEEQIKTAPKDATASGPRSPKIDPTAPAGSKNSLGQESVRDGRPTSDDSVVEAMDEETPVTPDSPDR
jgi:hypothetical protein